MTRLLLRCGAALALGAGVFGLVSSVAFAELNSISFFSTNFLVLLAYLIGWHALLGAPLAAAFVLWDRLRGGGSVVSRRPFLAGLLSFLATMSVVTIWLRFAPSFKIMTVPIRTVMPLSFVNWLVVPCAVGLVVAGVFRLVEKRGVTRAVAYVATGVLATAIVYVVNVAAEQPHPVELEKLLPKAGVVQSSKEPRPLPERRRVIVMGQDGLTWLDLSHLIAEGRLPNFRRLAEGGAVGALRTDVPTLSPRIWNTISTGRSPEEHGIKGFTQFEVPGIDKPISTGPYVTDTNWWAGVNRLLSGLAARRLFIGQYYMTQNMRVQPALWDIATHYGRTAGVVDWQATRPVDERIYYMKNRGSSSPKRLAELMERIPSVSPGPSDGQWPRDYAHRRHRDAQASREALRAYQEFQPDLEMSFVAIVDTSHHRFWKPDRGLFVSGEIPMEKLRPEIADAYSLVDSWIGEFLDAMGPDTVFVVVSDHGYNYNGYEHYKAPDGVAIVYGAGVRPGILKEPSIYDVTPTVLALLGVPVDESLEGRIWNEAFAGSLDPRYVDGYDWWTPPEHSLWSAVRGGTDETAAEMEREFELLRKLGYVN